MSVNYSARSGGIIRIFFDFLLIEGMLYTHKNRLDEAVLMSIHKILLSI